MATPFTTDNARFGDHRAELSSWGRFAAHGYRMQRMPHRGYVGTMSESPYSSLYRSSLEHPEQFWANAAQDIDWITPWTSVMDSGTGPVPRWFVGGELNTCYNALDRHADGGRGNQTALIYDSAVTNTVETYTYSELRDVVARFAGVLAARGIGKGDRVVIYMPMIPQAAIAMLACARLGAVHSVVFGGFASRELAVRIDDCRR
jgi:propionyl-CoA synthetase